MTDKKELGKRTAEEKERRQINLSAASSNPKINLRYLIMRPYLSQKIVMKSFLKPPDKCIFNTGFRFLT